MADLTETRRAASFIITEADGHLSRDNVTIAYGAGDLDPGTVLQSADVSITTLLVDLTNASHVATLDATTGLVAGRRYKIAGTSIPAGATFLGPATGLNINLQNAAGTAFVNATGNQTAEASTITENVSGQMEAWVTGGDATGLNIYSAKAAAAEVDVSAVTRLAEVNKYQLTYPDTTYDEAKASLLSLNIVVRA